MKRVLIVGAGPAGIRAAEILVAAGLRPVVADEGARAGGQIYRRPPEGFSRSPETLYGSEARKAVTLHKLFDTLVVEGRIDYRPERSCYGVADGVAHFSGPEGLETVGFDSLILATGAMDRMVPLPGWQSPGVYSLGAAQIALKAQGVALGQRIVLTGSGPLLTLVAAQLLKAGAGIAAVLDTAPMAAQVHGGLSMAMARPLVMARGALLRARLGRRYRAGVTLQRIETDRQGPRAVHWQDAQGRSHTTDCDTVALGWHLRAETALADVAGATFEWSETWRQWLVCADDMGRAGEALYLAGDGLRILGADGAEMSGKIAARACLADLDLSVSERDQARDLSRLGRMRRFAEGAATAFPWPEAIVRALPDETVLCRCEGVSVGDLRATLPLSGADANRAKSLARVGMGRCQGRYCQLAGAELIALSENISPAACGRLRAQPPVRPVRVAEITHDSSDAVAVEPSET